MRVCPRSPPERCPHLSTVYLDSSAIVKLAVLEKHSVALRGWLRDRTERVSCALARTEVLCALRATGPVAVAAGRSVLGGPYLVHLDGRLLDTTATIDRVVMRSLDAIHLAAAMSLGDDLSAVVS